MLFASQHVFNFYVTSRRDDLISLCYILIYFIDDNQLEFINKVVGMSKREKFRFIKNFKVNVTPEGLCGDAVSKPVTHKLTDFVKEVWSIQFTEAPNYNKLRFLLTKALLDVGKVPNKDYDWIAPSIRASRSDNAQRKSRN